MKVVVCKLTTHLPLLVFFVSCGLKESRHSVSRIGGFARQLVPPVPNVGIYPGVYFVMNEQLTVKANLSTS